MQHICHCCRDRAWAEPSHSSMLLLLGLAPHPGLLGTVSRFSAMWEPISSVCALRDSPALVKQIKMHRKGCSLQCKCQCFNKKVALNNYVHLFPISSRFRKAFNPERAFAWCPRVGFCNTSGIAESPAWSAGEPQSWSWLQPGAFPGGREKDNSAHYKPSSKLQLKKPKPKLSLAIPHRGKTG